MNYNAASKQISTQQNGLHIGRRGFLAAAAMTFPVSQAISGEREIWPGSPSDSLSRPRHCCTGRSLFAVQAGKLHDHASVP